MRIRREDRPGMEVKNGCTGCQCHEMRMTFGEKDGCCVECGCPKTVAAFDRLARPIPAEAR